MKRQRVHLRSVALAAGLLLAAAAACSGPDDTAEPTEALFEVPRSATPTSRFYALPYPNDLRVGADGRIDLSGHERPNPITELYVDTIAEQQRGFSLNAPVLFRFAGEMDASTLPAEGEPSRADGASVYLVNIDAASPSYGVRWPVKYRFETRAGTTIGSNWLSVVPFHGFPLDERTTYAVVVTNRFTTIAGDGATPSIDFLDMRDESGDAEVMAASAIYQPLWDYLDDAGGDERDDVATAAVFTTQDATGLVGKIREVIYRDAADPAPRDIVAVDTNTDYVLYDGLYDGPLFQSGTIPYARPESGGNIEIDASGDPILQAMTELRFAMSIPTGNMPAGGWPVTVYAHGTGGSYHTFVNNGTAAFLAREGIAVISIDQTLHGPRNPNGDPEVDFFNFQNPLSARDNALQGALDDFQLVRLVVGFDQQVGGSQLTFDDTRLFYFGHSQGGLTGLPFVAYEPLVTGAVFSGAGGNIVQSLLAKTAPVDIASLVRLLIRDDPLDEFNPVLGLIQGYLDRSDSINFGPLIAARPIDGKDPVHVFHSLGLIDTFTPVPAIKSLALSMEVDALTPVLEEIDGLELSERGTVSAPVSGNLNGVTAVVAQYDQLAGSDGHFVVFDIPAARTQSIQFLSTLASTGTATVVVP